MVATTPTSNKRQPPPPRATLARPVMETGPLAGEELFNLDVAASLFPSAVHGCATICRTTVRNWIVRGVVNLNRRRVYLAGVRVGISWLTSREALHRFQMELEGVTASDQPLKAEGRTRTPEQAKRAAEAAMDRERRRGLKI